MRVLFFYGHKLCFYLQFSLNTIAVLKKRLLQMFQLNCVKSISWKNLFLKQFRFQHYSPFFVIRNGCEKIFSFYLPCNHKNFLFSPKVN